MSKIHSGEQKRLLTFIWNTETNKHKCPKISEMMFRDIDNVISIMERTYSSSNNLFSCLSVFI